MLRRRSSVWPVALLCVRPSGATPPCRNNPSTDQFSYESGSGERPWLRGSSAGHICHIGLSVAQVNAARHWLAYASDSTGRARAPTDAEDRALSHFHCRDGRTEVIEPLSGVARHPLAQFMNPFECERRYLSGCSQCARNQHNRTAGRNLPAHYVDLFRHDRMDISYLVLQNHCGRPRHDGRNLLYDLGCGNYSRADGKAVDLTRGQGLGPSIPLFNALYERNCIVFDRIFAWEYIKYDPQVWWSDVPASVRGKLHFYNVPVDKEPSSSPGSFIQLLKTTATAQDFVAIKLDIDHPEIEQSIIEQIMSDPVVANLVDEVFIEIHFYFDGIDFGWGAHASQQHSVDDALSIMHRLRQLGIRAHFWI
ncbi:hypothetical protein AB1Y20_019828 [Prymnesium parvum]|uniref:Uncharacterized protein n=1 Tax=Prymnesium parvum TaxID=97485 RepID=A0AB34JVK3_PRYPA